LKYRHDIIINFKCPQCDKLVNTNVKLATHLYGTHRVPDPEVSTFKCPFTKKTFFNPDQLKIHINNTVEYFNYVHRENKEPVQPMELEDN